MKLNKKIIIALCGLAAVLVIGLGAVFTVFKLIKKSEVAPTLLHQTESASDLPSEMYPLTEGDVTELYNVRFRVNGRLMSSSVKTGVVDYVHTNADDEQSALFVSMQEGEREDVENAVLDYMNGDYDAIYTYLDTDEDTNDLLNYYYNVMGQTVVLFYNTSSDKYISVIPCDGGYLYAYCSDEFFVTHDTPTRIFDDPTKSPLTSHSFSRLERNAVDNTVRKLLDAGYSVETPTAEDTTLNYESSTAELTYTNASDNETRDQLAKYATYHWNADGTSSDTSYVLDLTSAVIKNSRWTLVESSSYSFTDNGLNLAKLYGTRTDDSLKITGVMSNKLSTPRPWVLVVELLDENEQLLGVRVIDERKHTIDGNGSKDFELEVRADEQTQIANIRHLQFIMY